MFLAKVRDKSIGMTRRVLPVFLVALVTLLVTAPKLWAGSFSKTKIIIEVNATAGDAGIQISVDGVGWKILEVFDPNGFKIFEVSGSASVGDQGVTELFFESAEPSLTTFPLDDFLQRFPEGDYTFNGTTVGGQPLNGKATLSHAIPAGPQNLSPAEGATVDPVRPVVIEWDEVTRPFSSNGSAVNIVAYQVIVERVKPTLRVFSVDVSPKNMRMSVTVPPEFIEPKTAYKFEVLAIEASGNQTIWESNFKTK